MAADALLVLVLVLLLRRRGERPGAVLRATPGTHSWICFAGGRTSGRLDAGAAPGWRSSGPKEGVSPPQASRSARRSLRLVSRMYLPVFFRRLGVVPV
ncbi:MAG: hypothetical protein R3E12_12830 [Candidatus Eisenbacteria bacterium]